MAVTLQFTVCQSTNCKSLIFQETTGAYSATNTGGWGNPNRATSTATTAVLTITPPNGTSYDVNLFTSSFPTTNTSQEYEIEATSIGQSSGSKWPDGIYTFVYTVTTVSGTTEIYTQTVKQAFYCQVKCCVYSMFTDIDLDCDCSEDAKVRAIDAWIMLQGLITSAGCGNVSNFEDDLETLQEMCNNNNCSNCK